MTYQEALTYLDGLNAFGIKLGLERITRLLELLGEPQKKYRTIHVTGTNGKGSTTAMLAEILAQSGVRAGMYTSPHLVSYTERMQVAGQPVGEAEFAECIFEVKAAVDRMLAEGEECPTQFEVLTAAAFFYFASAQVEYAVVEVGLGGLLDSTNVIAPEICVITNVTLEHADRCGGTLQGVAEHKAGIIKEGVPVVTAARGEALEIIRRAAEEKNADVFVYKEDFSSAFEGVEAYQQKLHFSSDLLAAGLDYRLGLLGECQIENSAVAVMTALLLAHAETRVGSEAISRAMAAVRWPGRFELVCDGARCTVIDGAHNPAGAAALRKNLDLYFEHRPVVFLFGALRDKDVDGMVHALFREEDEVVITEPDSERAAPPLEIATRIRAGRVEVCASLEAAVARAVSLAGDDKVLCAAGSLYLIGRVRELLSAAALETGGICER